MGERVSDTATIDASMDTVWAVITDLEAYPQWAEGMLETEVLATDETGAPHRARFRVDARVAEVTYVLEYAYDGYDVSWHLVEGETVSQLDGIYELWSEGEGTGVRYSVEVDIDIPVPGFLKKRAAKQILATGLAGLGDRALAAG